MIRHHFQVHMLNSVGIAKAKQLAELFSTLLDDIEKIVPAGREMSLVITKLQEASFFAKRGIATDTANQAEGPEAGKPQ